MLKKNERLGRLRLASPKSPSVFFEYGSIRKSEGGKGVAVVISKKTCNTAVKRNLLRRRLYSILRSFIQDSTISKGVIVYPNKKAVSATFKSLESSLHSVFKGKN